jgi:thiosulfate/3-mercaptopyruvate sulfurtransferase
MADTTAAQGRWMAARASRRGAGVFLLWAGGALATACGAGGSGAGATAGAPVRDAASAGLSVTSVAAGADPRVLMNAARLRGSLGDASAAVAAGVLIVDARPATEYEKGHILGAVSLPVTETFDPARDKNYPDAPERLRALFGSRGIRPGAPVVVYDNGKETPAGRLFWTLEYLGHESASVLDGGLGAWQAIGGELSVEQVRPDLTSFTAAVQPSRAHAKSDCERMIGGGPSVGLGAGPSADTARGVVMLDSRSPEEWRGDDVRAKYGGHIPGAVNIDWRENFGADGLLKPVEALRALYAGKGVTPDKEVVAYCQTGQRSSVTYLALRLLGYPNVANYAGSWIEWGNDPATPKQVA